MQSVTECSMIALARTRWSVGSKTVFDDLWAVGTKVEEGRLGYSDVGTTFSSARHRGCSLSGGVTRWCAPTNVGKLYTESVTAIAVTDGDPEGANFACEHPLGARKIMVGWKEGETICECDTVG